MILSIQALEQRNEMLALLRRLVVGFCPQSRTDGKSCPYCHRDDDLFCLDDIDHTDSCAWLAAKRFLEELDDGLSER